MSYYISLFCNKLLNDKVFKSKQNEIYLDIHINMNKFVFVIIIAIVFCDERQTFKQFQKFMQKYKKNMIQFKNILHDIKFLKEILKKCQKYQMMNYSKMELTNLQI